MGLLEDAIVVDDLLKNRKYGAHIRVLPVEHQHSAEFLAQQLYGSIHVRHDARRNLWYCIAFGPAKHTRAWRRLFHGGVIAN